MMLRVVYAATTEMPVGERGDDDERVAAALVAAGLADRVCARAHARVLAWRRVPP
jgi:hypothetical protein